MANEMAFPTIPGYSIVRQIATGGMGVVYQARQDRPRREVAIKVLAAEHAGDREMRARFQRECAILATIEHPNVVALYDMGEVRGQPFLVMECLFGITAAERLREGQLPVSEALTIAADTVGGLQAALAKGVVHRDVKPSNIFLTASGGAKVLDFGCARRYDVDPTLTQHGALVGTPAYASPEQFRGEQVTWRSDVYSLGIALYELMAGTRPFEATNYFQLMHHHTKDDIPALAEAPTHLMALIRDMTHKNPLLRPAYKQVATALSALLTDVPTDPKARIELASTDAAAATPPGRFAHLIGRCFCCGTEYPNFDSVDRLCRSPNCPSQVFQTRHPRHRKFFISILPERRETGYDFILPRLGDRTDVFAQAAAFPEIPEQERMAATGLPYTADHLAQLGLRCGRPILYESPHIAGWAGFRRVFILDMATYAWSHTLKDARSWAIMNVALENGFRRLALYTAGNAGMSIARLAYDVNRVVGGEESKFRVSLFVDDNVTTHMRTLLTRWGAEVLSINDDGAHLIDSDTLWLRLRKDTDAYVGNIPPDGWHVTDGWDGVGTTMYRLLIAQVLQQIDASYVVVPLGTGSLFLGAFLGIRDATAVGHGAHLCGVLPEGENALRVVREIDLPKARRSDSVMEKLVGRYTPLAPCLAVLDSRQDVSFVEVTEKMLRRAAPHVLGNVACEPSSLAAFGSLRGADGSRGVNDVAQLAEDASHPGDVYYNSPSSVLVVSSGLGLLTDRERLFLGDDTYRA